MSFGLLRIEGTITALSPIVHGGNEKTGATVLLRREKFIIDGKPVDVPMVSGNAIRGYLRRLVMADFLKQVDYAPDISKKGGLRLYHALFTGGLLETVDASSSGVIDIEFKKKVVSLIPPAVMFGFSFGNQTIESKLKVGKAIPIAKELAPFLPDRFKPERSFYELITTAFQTRKDDLKAGREKGEQAVQMIIEYEAFAAGTQFYHKFMIEDPTPLDEALFARMLELWEAKPFIGGKSSIGFGEIKFDYDFQGSSEPYLKFLKEHRDEIVEVLETLEGRKK